MHDEVGVKNLMIPRSNLQGIIDCKEIVSSYSEVYIRQGTVAHCSVQLFEDVGTSFEI